jgi:tetratricopeptide (TPR) repeat protein
MPGHIFARLGMWQEDIDSNLASVAASQQDERLHQPGVAHQMHADEFLIYAYLQTAQDDKAKSLTDSLRSIGAHVDSLPGPDDMKGRSARYVNELRSIYRLEMHDWPAIKALQPMMGGNGMDTWYVFWAQGIAAGYLHDAALSSAALARFDDVMAMVKSSGNAYMLNDMEIYRNEMLGWKAFIAGDNDAAVTAMRAAADQQDKLGQGEVDLPAREMLGDLLMQLHKPQDALAEYKVALTLSPNRLNGLLSAGEAAEAAGLPGEAKPFYTLAAASTHNGKDTTRSDVAHAVQVATATAQPKAAPPPAAAATAQSKPAAKSKPKVAPRVSAPTSQQ